MSNAVAEPQQMEFKTELRQLLDLIIHSLYTKKEIFLRELISNAADAIDRVRFESLTRQELLEGNSQWKIKLAVNEKAGTLTVSDNGIGMSCQEIVENLGTIARSGTRAFVESLKQADAQNRPEMIGQFGVGFYASFMVADRVIVVSRPAGDPEAGVQWESDGQGQFSVRSAAKETRGTDVILHLREDAKEFFSPWRLREIVKHYSDFIDHPIVMDMEQEKDGKKTVGEEAVNSRQAIWLRSKAQVKDQEYKEFFKQLSRDLEDPLQTIHYEAQGAQEFRALMFVPAHRPLDWMMGPEHKSGLDLYVRRVLIQHECEELIPPYLRFIRGVVDSADLPLNVSRQTLQHDPRLAKIRSNLVNRILKTLEEMRNDQREVYEKFFKEFGAVLKEGVQDWDNRARITDLLLFQSTAQEAGKTTTLEKYVEHMPAGQKDIYYLIGESREAIENSPYLESFKAAGQEVLLLSDPVDEFLMQTLGQYKDKAFKAVDRAQTAGDEAAQKRIEEAKDKFKDLMEFMAGKLPEVQEVRLSSRLKESAACLVADEHGLSAYLERLMQRMGREKEMPKSKRILEINPGHPVVEAMRKLREQKADDPLLESYALLLYEQALLAEGSRIKDVKGFAQRLNNLMQRGIGA